MYQVRTFSSVASGLEVELHFVLMFTTGFYIWLYWGSSLSLWYYIYSVKIKMEEEKWMKTHTHKKGRFFSPQMSKSSLNVLEKLGVIAGYL